eukprot:3937564-Rhodomonas_salina.3
MGVERYQQLFSSQALAALRPGFTCTHTHTHTHTPLPLLSLPLSVPRCVSACAHTLSAGPRLPHTALVRRRVCACT